MIVISVKDELRKSAERKLAPKPLPKIIMPGGKVIVISKEERLRNLPIEPADDIDEIVEGAKTSASSIINTEKSTDLLNDLKAELAALELKRNKLSTSIYYQVHGRTTPNSIEISEVLNRLNRTYDETNMQQRTFGIRALSAKGQTELLHCRKKIIDKKRETSTSDFKHNLQQHGNIMLIRNDGQTRTIKVCAIYEFQDHNSKIWTRVRH